VAAGSSTPATDWGQRQFFLRTIISPTLKASAPKKVAKGSTPTITGTLKMGTTGIVGKNVLLEYSTNNKTWKDGRECGDRSIWRLLDHRAGDHQDDLGAGSFSRARRILRQLFRPSRK